MNKFIFLAFLGLATIAFMLFVPGAVNAQYTGCTYHSYQQCVGNDLYWYNSCGNQQDYIGNCSNYNNNYNNNYNYNSNYFGNCTYHAYKLCQGSNIYWYDSCGTQQDLYYTCGGGQVCQYGQCTSYVQPINNYVAHHNIKCYSDSLYWYDSLGVMSGLYKSCSDGNACTIDSCFGGKCSNTLKCDGTTCATGSTEYTKYCSGEPAPTDKCGDGTCETTVGETIENCPSDCKTNTIELSVSFFNRESASGQWQKTAQVSSNGQVYFMISVQNNSTTQVNDATVSVNIPTEVYSLGNVQIDGVTVLGDIVSGINVGQLLPSGSKSITFEGRTQALSTDEVKQATASVTASGTTKSDTVSIDFNPEQVTAAISGTSDTTGFLGFLKHWYLWILGAVVLIFLFAIVFKRLSSES